jgi:3-dehydroquinate synthase
MGLISQEIVNRQERLLRDFGLPINSPGVDTGGVLTAIEFDKKVSGRKISWVLLEGIGSAVVRSDVPTELVNDVVSSLSS